MEIKFREKKQYCKDADMYLFDIKDTKERKLKVRKIIKIILVIEAVICVIAVQNGILSFGKKSYVNIHLLSLVVTGIILTLGIMIGFFILDKIGFDFAEKRGRKLLNKIGGRNYEKYVDADVKIVCNDDRIIWTRASKRLDVGYEEIRKIDDTGEYIYILVNKHSVIWVPSEAFISMEARKNFLNYLTLKHKEK